MSLKEEFSLPVGYVRSAGASQIVQCPSNRELAMSMGLEALARKYVYIFKIKFSE